MLPAGSAGLGPGGGPLPILAAAAGGGQGAVCGGWPEFGDLPGERFFLIAWLTYGGRCKVPLLMASDDCLFKFKHED